MAHTPGEWRIGDQGHTVFGPKTDSPSPKTIARNLSRADARLIAAAPKLLEALERISEIANPTPAKMNSHAGLMAIYQARQAIREAKEAS